MTKKLILHIPHSSTYIPSYDGYLVSSERIDKEILKLTDWYTDDLFATETDILVKAEFSRVFCDVERFSDDEDEPMAAFGMGVVYEKTDSGEPMREISADLRQHILDSYYWKHHNHFANVVNQELQQRGTALIVDCHSYSNIPFLRDRDQRSNRPDFCIGTDDNHTPPALVEASVAFFGDKGYSVGVNTPYSGSIVPLEHYEKKNKSVRSIMLEVNRKLYLTAASNQQNETYEETKETVQEYLRMIRST